MMDNELLLLGLLNLQNMHGYQLNEFLDKRLNFLTDLKRSTAYYLLNKLEERGLIARQVERQGNRPERYVYELTPAGQARFRELLLANLRQAHRPYYNTDIGLLFMSALTPEELRAALVEKRAGLVQMLDELRGYVNQHPAGSPARYALQHNVVHLKAELTWLDQILAEMNGRHLVETDLLSCVDPTEEVEWLTNDPGPLRPVA